MNRITQCLYSRGTVSAVMRHRHTRQDTLPGRLLAFAGMLRPVVFWNITNRCNLACTHCYGTSGPGCGMEGELTTAEARVIIDDLAALRVPLIIFTGGEPLLRADIWELAQYAKNYGIKTALSTNGTLITADTAGKIRQSGIEYVGISLDGACAETHDRFRGTPGAFSRSTAAFAQCREAGVRCGVRVTLTKENYGDLSRLIDLSRTLGASRFCLYWLVPSGRGSEAYDQLQLTGAEVAGALDLLYRKAQESDPDVMEFLTVDAPQDAVHLLAAMEHDRSPDLPDAQELIASMKGGCSAGSRVANIDPQGDIYPCQFARLPEFLIGNVRKRPFSSLWTDDTNPVLGRFRKKAELIAGRCGTCRHLALCGGGCRVRAHASSGDFSADDPFCFIAQAEKEG